ncbi:MAG: proline racemase family protein [Thermodesulfobacteriota bacterium]
MDISRIREGFKAHYTARIITVDSHTAGEGTRLIVGGIDPIPGETMKDKLCYYQAHLDHIRLLLTREPRSGEGLLAAHLTEPTSADGDFGLIYMDARRYPYLCGHATIGAVTTLIETGVLPAKEPEMMLKVDTPSGPMSARALIVSGRVESVAIRMVPSFVLRTAQSLEVTGFGRIDIDLVYAGGFFAMVSLDQVARIGLSTSPQRNPRLIELGMAVIEAANRQLTVTHPTRPEVTTVDVTEFYDPAGHEKGRGKSIVIYGESHMDRSPCGTGTTAKMTLLHHRGLLAVKQPYLNEGPLGTRFEGRILKETTVGDHPAVAAEISGSAQITGYHEFVLDRQDPFPEGFIL